MGLTGSGEDVPADTVRGFLARVEREVSSAIADRATVRARLARLRVVLLALHMGTEPLAESITRAIAILAEPLPPPTRGQ